MTSVNARSVVTRPPTYQAIIGALQSFWEKQGCVVVQPYHTEVGAGTFNPATFLRCLDARPGGPPMSSPPRGRPTAATARTRSAAATTSSTRS